MIPFVISVGGKVETFRPNEDFNEGHERLHWSLEGIEKLIRLGLWHREYDLRGRLKSKPPQVEKVIEAALRKPVKKPQLPLLSQ
jgi:hypothetical protein